VVEEDDGLGVVEEVDVDFFCFFVDGSIEGSASGSGLDERPALSLSEEMGDETLRFSLKAIL
jgi:hypothetical protein